MESSERKVIKKKIGLLLKNKPELFPAIKASYIDSDTIHNVLSEYPEFIRYVKNPSFNMCEFAVKMKPSCLEFVPKKFSKFLRFDACVANPEIAKNFPFDSWSTKELIDLITKNPSVVKYISFIPKKFCDYAITVDPNVALILY